MILGTRLSLSYVRIGFESVKNRMSLEVTFVIGKETRNHSKYSFRKPVMCRSLSGFSESGDKNGLVSSWNTAHQWFDRYYLHFVLNFISEFYKLPRFDNYPCGTVFSFRFHSNPGGLGGPLVAAVVQFHGALFSEFDI